LEVSPVVVATSKPMPTRPFFRRDERDPRDARKEASESTKAK
jgi:hypothetical protein